MPILISTTTNFPCILCQNHALQNLRKNNIVITKPDEENTVVILDQKLYDNTVQEIISDTTRFRKLNEGPTLKHEASLQCFLHELKQKNFLSENEYDKLYPPGSAPV